MAYIPLTELGKQFITNICVDLFVDKKTGYTKLHGKESYPFPFSGPPQLDYVWTCNILYNNKPVLTGTDLAGALQDWFGKYAKMYELDANVIAAQAYIESHYVMWAYPSNSTASGVNQFTMLTIFQIIVQNGYNVSPLMTTDEINKITNNLKESSYKDSYNTKIKPAEPDTQTTAYKNRATLHQNVIDNPEIMIKAQCRYMKYFANECNSLASTSLFCYSRGMFMSNTYSRAIQKCDAFHLKLDNDSNFKYEGIDYVLRIFGVLGDKDNVISIKGYKPKGIYFGYDEHQGIDDPKNLRLDKSIKGNEFNAFNANVQESGEFGLQDDINENDSDPVVVNLSKNSNKYKFIRFSEAYYNRVSTIKKQIVLHHTASGPGIGNDILWWEQQVKINHHKVSVSFIVTREGTILQLFSTKYWAYHLGITQEMLNEYGVLGLANQNEILNSQSIGIELDNWGGLVNSGGNWYPPVHDNITIADINSTSIPIDNVVQYSTPLYPQGYHGFYGFEKYTDAQLASLKIVLQAIVTANDIPLGYVNDTYHLDGINNSMWGTDVVPGVWKAEKDAYAQNKGIWTHVSYVSTNSDCQPQQELIDMLKSL